MPLIFYLLTAPHCCADRYLIQLQFKRPAIEEWCESTQPLRILCRCILTRNVHHSLINCRRKSRLQNNVRLWHHFHKTDMSTFANESVADMVISECLDLGRFSFFHSNSMRTCVTCVIFQIILSAFQVFFMDKVIGSYSHCILCRKLGSITCPRIH